MVGGTDTYTPHHKMPSHAACSSNPDQPAMWASPAWQWKRGLGEPGWLEAGSGGTGWNSFFLDHTLHTNN